MSVTLIPVVRDDLRPLFKLKVSPDQTGFVAPNEITLAQAPYETGAYVFAVRDGETHAGLAAMIDFREHAYLTDIDDPQAAYLWRLSIGAEHQGKGHGRAAMGWLIDWAKTRGNPRMMTSAVETNTAALRFYESLGFRPTGAMEEAEVVLSRDL